MIGSFLLLVLILSAMGRWEVIALAAWLSCGAAALTRHGERAAVTSTLGFRRPNAIQAEALEAVWATALGRAGIANTEAELYVHRSREQNAYAAGKRSVAVTSGLLQQFTARRLSEEQMVGILLHELGHHADGATTVALQAAWFALPWKIASRLVIGLGLVAVGRTKSTRTLVVVVLAGVAVSVVQAVQQAHWIAALALGAVSLCAVVCPIADAAGGRRSEYAADQYARALGHGPQLASALNILADERRQPASIVARTLSRHPSTTSRIAALDGARGPI